MGWQLFGQKPDLEKYIIVVAPHTSNWDFFIGGLYLNTKGIRSKILIKKEAFFFPLGWIFKIIGGIPVDRYKRNYISEQMVDLFSRSKKMILIITPEGTRKKVSNWKKGFHRIAKQIDYGRKIVGINKAFELTDDIDADMIRLKNYYKNIIPKYTGKFSENPAD
jgi:1-acyl-sn-glycerol-3-phosphate acyltransferase